MMYFVHKLVGWMLSPLGFFFIGFLVSVACVKRGYRRSAKVCMAVSLGVLWLFSTAIATRIIGAPLEREFRASEGWCNSIGDVGRIDLICVLGGGVCWHEVCRAPEMCMAADRVWQGARLWKMLVARGAEDAADLKIALSGGDVQDSTVPIMTDFGVPEGNFIYFPDAKTTEDEARMIAASGVRRIALVTSAWHMRRSRLLFESAGLEVVPVATDFEMTAVAERVFSLAEFVPNPDDLLRNSCAVKEWIAFAIYKILK